MAGPANPRQPRAHDYHIDVLHTQPLALASARYSLGHDLDCSKLSEVMIKREGHCDAELFHNHFTGAVSETPTFVIELLERLPCK